ncbi:MAG: glucose-1-phosphate cytidylyltransferase [Selenomonadaceae bacterium]|nr:glucose-1-phosphate cytidylyltransferase [Selenomonadaceae bacterium]
MKTVILAGGLPSTIEMDEDRIPKPMAVIGERPILWHIMKLFSFYGYNDFIICAGFRSDLIKEYFLNYYIYSSDITVHLKSNRVDIHNKVTEPWHVSVVDTGLFTTTAERLYRVRSMLEEDFFVVYGDCVSNLDVPSLAASHKEAGKLMTAVLAKPSGRNSIVPLDADGSILAPNASQPVSLDAWANACIMAVSPDVVHRKPFPRERFEVETMQRLAAARQVNAYRHDGFWSPVETVRDRDCLQAMWDEGNPPWRIWLD